MLAFQRWDQHGKGDDVVIVLNCANELKENYQIGFVDIADTPYAETVSASRTVAETMYALRLGD